MFFFLNILFLTSPLENPLNHASSDGERLFKLPFNDVMLTVDQSALSSDGAIQVLVS